MDGLSLLTARLAASQRSEHDHIGPIFEGVLPLPLSYTSSGRIIELAGPAAVGKTQLCLRAASNAAAQLGAGAIYVTNSALHPSGRLCQIESERLERAWRAAIDVDDETTTVSLAALFPHSALRIEQSVRESIASAGESMAGIADMPSFVRSNVEANLRASINLEMTSPLSAADPAVLAHMFAHEAKLCLEQISLYQVFDAWSLLALLRELERWLVNNGDSAAAGGAASDALSSQCDTSLGAGDGAAASGSGSRDVDASSSQQESSAAEGDSDDAPPPGAHYLAQPPPLAYSLLPAGKASSSADTNDASGDPSANDSGGAMRTGGFALPSLRPRLLVIDSIGALLAPSLGGGPRQHTGHAIMAECGRCLIRVSRAHGVMVLVTNSVVADRDAPFAGGRSPSPPPAAAAVSMDAQASSSTSQQQQLWKPALGPSWRYVPDISLLMLPHSAAVGRMDGVAWTVVKNNDGP